MKALLLCAMSLLSAPLDDDAAARRFVKTLRGAGDLERRAEVADAAFAELKGRDSQAVLDALVTVYAWLEQEAEDVEDRRRGTVARMGQRRDDLDPIRDLQDRVITRLSAVRDVEARRQALLTAMRGSKLPLLLRLTLADLGVAAEEGVDAVGDALADGGRQPERLHVALRAARSMRRSAAPLADALSGMLEHPLADVRIAAAQALAETAAPGGIEPLIEALAGSEGAVELAMGQSLEKLTRQKLGVSAPAWRRWWSDHRDAAMAGDLPLGDGDIAAGKAAEGYYFGLPRPGTSVLFVVDASKSMNKRLSKQLSNMGQERRVDRSRDELKRAVAALPKDARFNIIAYADRMRVLADGMVKATPKRIREAQEWIDDQALEFGTNTYGALEAAFSIAGRGAHDGYYGTQVDTIYFLSDGLPTMPVMGGRAPADKAKRILGAVRRWNSLKRVTVHTIALGEAGKKLMNDLATENGGVAVRIGGKATKKKAKRD